MNNIKLKFKIFFKKYYLIIVLFGVVGYLIASKYLKNRSAEVPKSKNIETLEYQHDTKSTDSWENVDSQIKSGSNSGADWKRIFNSGQDEGELEYRLYQLKELEAERFIDSNNLDGLNLDSYEQALRSLKKIPAFNKEEESLQCRIALKVVKR